MISGQRQGSDKEGSYSALKGSIESYSRSEAWDMTIIDEAHLSFNNYFGISASKSYAYDCNTNRCECERGTYL